MIAAFRDRLGQLPGHRRVIAAVLSGALGLALVVGLGVALLDRPAPARAAFHFPVQVQVQVSPSAEPTSVETTPSPAPAPANLPVVDYGPAPAGFPADPDPGSIEPLTEGAHPTVKISAYDAPGGQPRAFLAPTISGVQVTMPIVARRVGWVAVMLPSANRTVAWLPPGGWESVRLRDHIVVRRTTHELSWYRDGALQRTWKVTLGAPKTPTPLGRTFILGRSRLPGEVYAGVDVMALGSVPDDVNALPPGLRGAHIGIHTWYNDNTLGKDVSDGCIRLTKTGQQLLLSEVIPGSAVMVID